MKNSIYKGLLLILFIGVSSFWGCVGGSKTVKAENLEYPASLTESIYDKDMNIINNKDYVVVHSFEFSTTKWATLWGLISLSGSLDISKDLNDIIKDNNGDAIVNLKIGSHLPLYNACNLITIVGPIIIPSSINISVSGDVVQLNKK